MARSWGDLDGTWADQRGSWATFPARLYFLPPAELVLPPKWKQREIGIVSPAMKHFVDFYRGQTVEVGGKTYVGGYWHEITDAEAEALTAAGYGGRIVEIAEGADERLPAGLDP